MKLLHLGDLHIGKRMNDVSLIEDQKYALKQIVEIAKSEEVNGVLLSGDIFDKSTPSDEAFLVYGEFLSSLVDLGVKIYMISGNHDSSNKLSYCQDIFEKSNIHIFANFTDKINKYELTDEFGEVNIYLLPYVRLSQIAKLYPDTKFETIDDAFKALFKDLEIDSTKRNILVMHQFLLGSEQSESEEVNIGGLDAITSDTFKNFDYVALGHLHKNQKVKYDNIRYSGSLLKYSFSEVDHVKGPNIIEINEKNDINIKQVPIEFLHDVKIIKGTYDEINALEDCDDFLKVIITDEIPPIDAKYYLQLKFKNMLIFKIENSKTKMEGASEEVIRNIEKLSISDLFSEFYKERTSQDLTEAQKDVLRKIIRRMEEDARWNQLK